MAEFIDPCYGKHHQFGQCVSGFAARNGADAKFGGAYGDPYGTYGTAYGYVYGDSSSSDDEGEKRPRRPRRAQAARTQRAQDLARDEAAVTGAVMRAGANARAGRAPANRQNIWGGGLRRSADSEARVYREDTTPLRMERLVENGLATALDETGNPFRPDWPAGPATNPPVAGRAVPVGFARYVSPVINLGDYQFRRVAAWRVAIPRAMPELRVQDLLDRIWNYGPASAGYVRIGSTLVPATLEPGARAALSGAADNGVGGTLGYNSSGLSDFRDV